MKPFDLEAAKRGEPICTRDGRDVKFIAHVPEARPHLRLIVLIKDWINVFPETGIAAPTGNCVSDLCMKPKKKTVWVNLYEDCSWTNHYTKEDADLAADLRGDGYGGERLDGKAFKLEIEE